MIGATGSGKSVLARRLSDEWELPLYELDVMFFDRKGDQLPAHEFVRAVSDLTQRDAWVLDGHYRAVRELIWHRAGMVIWLNYPLWLVGWRLLKRFMNKRTERGRRLSGSAAGEDPNDRRAQINATWRDRLGRLARTVRERQEYRQILKAPEYRLVELVELKSVRATEDFVRTRRHMRRNR